MPRQNKCVVTLALLQKHVTQKVSCLTDRRSIGIRFSQLNRQLKHPSGFRLQKLQFLSCLLPIVIRFRQLHCIARFLQPTNNLPTTIKRDVKRFWFLPILTKFLINYGVLLSALFLLLAVTLIVLASVNKQRIAASLAGVTLLLLLISGILVPVALMSPMSTLIQSIEDSDTEEIAPEAP